MLAFELARALADCEPEAEVRVRTTDGLEPVSYIQGSSLFLTDAQSAAQDETVEDRDRRLAVDVKRLQLLLRDMVAPLTSEQKLYFEDARVALERIGELVDVQRAS